MLKRPVLMGILNCTPDSFSDGGVFNTTELALKQAQQLVADGADVIDVGGESTRPGAEPITLAEEQDRILGVIQRIAEEVDCVISVDTRHAETAHLAHSVGATWLNDVAGLRGDGMLSAAQKFEQVIIMHMNGTPKDMQTTLDANVDIVRHVKKFFEERLQACADAGIEQHKIWLDPGIGFGKTDPQNCHLLSDMSAFKSLGCQLMLGVSRKSFIGRICDIPVASARDTETHALFAALLAKSHIDGARVHDVRSAASVRTIINAIRSI